MSARNLFSGRRSLSNLDSGGKNSGSRSRSPRSLVQAHKAKRPRSKRVKKRKVRFESSEICEILNKMMTGEIMLKYSSRGPPSRQTFRINSECTKIYWIKKASAGERVGWDLGRVLSVQRGRNTKKFKKYNKENGMPLRMRSFSLYTTHQTLDIEADTHEQREMWIKGLEYCMKQVRKPSTRSGSVIRAKSLNVPPTRKERRHSDGGKKRRSLSAFSSPRTRVVKHGWLKKRHENRLKQYHKRFLVLRSDGSLSYYLKDILSKSFDYVEPKGVIQLDDIKNITARQNSSKVETVKIETKSRTFVFATGSERDQMSWIDAIESEMKRRDYEATRVQEEKELEEGSLINEIGIQVECLTMNWDKETPLYVKIVVGNKESQTSVNFQSPNPVWENDNTFFFQKVKTAQKIEATVWESRNRSDKRVGKTSLNLGKSNLNSLDPISLILRDKKGHKTKPRKMLHLSAWETSYSELAIEIVSAHLDKDDSVGQANPFARITVNDVSRQTEIIEETLTPEWNDANLYNFHDIESRSMLVFEVFDSTNGQDDLLGTAKIRMCDVFLSDIVALPLLNDLKEDTFQTISFVARIPLSRRDSADSEESEGSILSHVSNAESISFGSSIDETMRLQEIFPETPTSERSRNGSPVNASRSGSFSFSHKSMKQTALYKTKASVQK